MVETWERHIYFICIMCIASRDVIIQNSFSEFITDIFRLLIFCSLKHFFIAHLLCPFLFMWFHKNVLSVHEANGLISFINNCLSIVKKNNWREKKSSPAQSSFHWIQKIDHFIYLTTGQYKYNIIILLCFIFNRFLCVFFLFIYYYLESYTFLTWKYALWCNTWYIINYYCLLWKFYAFMTENSWSLDCCFFLLLLVIECVL